VSRPLLGVISAAAFLAICVAIALVERRHRGTLGRQLRRAAAAGVWPVLAATAAFWALTAFNSPGLRTPFESRYMYVGAILIVLLTANLLKGVEIGRRALIGAAACAAVIVGLNLVPLFEGEDYLDEQSVYARADLGAVEIARGSVNPEFGFDPGYSGTISLINIKAGPYLALVEEDGSPAYTPAELARAPEFGRRRADVILANALPLTTDTTPGLDRAPPEATCRTAEDGPEAPEIDLEPGVTTVVLAPGGRARLLLRRFATEGYPLVVSGVAAPSTTTLSVPRDAVARPWRLRIEAVQKAEVCRL
jgi:hypothetical protein